METNESTKKHAVNLSEIGECFYAWLDMLCNGASILFIGEKGTFPLPLKYNSRIQYNQGSNYKSGTLQKINSELSKLDENILSRFEKEFNSFLEDVDQKMPQKIEQELTEFFASDNTEKKAALIHIRHKGLDKRDLKQVEFRLIVESLEGKNFSHFILIGDLSKISNDFKTYIENEPRKFFKLDYLKDGKYEECLKQWMTRYSSYSLIKQIQLIRLIRENFSVGLLIGRKSGAGLDIHAYAGMPTIFLEDDINNQRYASPKKNENSKMINQCQWEGYYLPLLVPVYCPVDLFINNKNSINLFSHKKNDSFKQIKEDIQAMCDLLDSQKRVEEDSEKDGFSCISSPNRP